MVQSIECFHHKASFGDAELRELNTKILNADATTEDAERYLDLSYELSQAYLESMLGRPPYPNRSRRASARLADAWHRRSLHGQSIRRANHPIFQQ